MSDAAAKDAQAPVGPDGQERSRAERDAGNTHWSQQTGGTQPRQPNERDESADDQAPAQAPAGDVGRKAYADAAGPTQDTGRAPVTDRVYNEGVREGAAKRSPGT